MTTAMSTFERSLRDEIDALKKAGTYKQLRHLTTPMAPEVHMEEAGDVIVLSSNNYLGLSDLPEVIEAGKKGLDKYGAGTASVRFICGTLDIHRTLGRPDRGVLRHRSVAVVRRVLECKYRPLCDGVRRRIGDRLGRAQPRLDHRRRSAGEQSEARASTSTATWPISRRNCKRCKDSRRFSS